MKHCILANIFINLCVKYKWIVEQGADEAASSKDPCRWLGWLEDTSVVRLWGINYKEITRFISSADLLYYTLVFKLNYRQWSHLTLATNQPTNCSFSFPIKVIIYNFLHPKTNPSMLAFTQIWWWCILQFVEVRKENADRQLRDSSSFVQKRKRKISSYWSTEEEGRKTAFGWMKRKHVPWWSALEFQVSKTRYVWVPWMISFVFQHVLLLVGVGSKYSGQPSSL